jgi:hypothetical protein
MDPVAPDSSEKVAIRGTVEIASTTSASPPLAPSFLKIDSCAWTDAAKQ